MTAFGEIRGHGLAHDAQADETDFAHLAPPANGMRE
jgi:hypothetical protein